jgi:HlyD family secretion protein
VPRAVGTALLLGAVIVAAGFALLGREGDSREYITAPVERGVIATAVEATGRVEAVSMVDVSSQLSGRIAKVFVDFNDSVKAGQPIAELDSGIFIAQVNEAQAAVSVAKAKVQLQQATLRRARLAVDKARTDRQLAEDKAAGTQARLGEAEREFGRKLALARTGDVAERDVTQARSTRDAVAADQRAAIDEVALKSQTAQMAEADVQMAEADLENAQAEVEQREAALDQARLDLDRTVLRAPIDGVIIKRDVNPGQTVAVTLEAKTLFTIVQDLRRMEVDGKIDEADIGRLKVGQSTRFTVDAYPERSFTGTVLQVRKAPESKQNVVTYTVIVSADNPDLLLLPGMTATLRIVTSQTSPVLKIPTQALRFRLDQHDGAGEKPTSTRASTSGGRLATVWVLEEDRPRPVYVEIGASDDASVEVKPGGLREGQPVIIETTDTPSRHSFFGLRLGF